MPADSGCDSRIRIRLDHGLKNFDDARRLSIASLSLASSSNEGRRSLDGRMKLDLIESSNIDLDNKDKVLALFEDKLVIHVSNVPLTLSMSFVTGLSDLTEDEVIPKSIPVQVKFNHFNLEKRSEIICVHVSDKS